ncbi:hypothetical protein Tco_0938080 [Tanacetum coccineum]|uniref:Xylulose kinase-1 n=1 Tax=Tanacetum coccineum TaxID=301880 RepID=A0ABQ5DGR6_9ASTR
MANLKYSDKHNMVAFLKKPNESVGFTEVVDFLKGTSLRYALTHNPTIYDSLVKQFWQTATVRTLANGTQQLIASIDSKEYTITEASVRSKLQLADATGIHNLSDAEIYAGLATLGYVTEDITTEHKGRGSCEPHHTPVDPTSPPLLSPPHPSPPPHSPLPSPHHSPPFPYSHISAPPLSTISITPTHTSYHSTSLEKGVEGDQNQDSRECCTFSEGEEPILFTLQRASGEVKKKISGPTIFEGSKNIVIGSSQGVSMVDINCLKVSDIGGEATLGILPVITVLDELTGKYVVLDEGADIQLEVPDETKNLDENPKSLPSDTIDQNESKESEDDENESKDDDDERVKTDDDRDNEEEDDDRSINIKETDTERTNFDEEHQGKGDADMNIEPKVEKEMSKEKPKGDAQATEAQPNDDNKDKFEFLQPTLSQSLSSGFANQFLLNFPNASLLGTITELAEGDIISMIDVHIQQDVPNVVPEPFHTIIVYVIPEATQAPPPLLAAATQLKETDFSSVIHDFIMSQVPSIVDNYLRSSLPNAFCKELQANNTALKKELSKLNYKEVIEESVKAHVVTKVKNFLPQFLPKAVSDFATPIIEESVKAHAVNEDVIEESVKAHVKRDRDDDDQDEDPSVGSNQGKPISKPSKSGKSRSANDTVKEIVFEMGSDDVDQTFEKMVDASEQPSPDANTEQPSPNVAANPKRQKNDWYKKSPSPEPHDPDWNTIKKIDDAREQSWFKEKVNIAVPSLTFDELMSTPIDFSAFAMNRLGLTTLTREVLVGHVFNLLKGTCKSYGELEYNFEECFRALPDQLD